jgi:phosphoenolpyruvate synthase/pyruvate phosphate dikinase
VTTDAFQRILTEAPSIDDRLDRLSRLEPEDGEAIRALSAEIRRAVEGIAIPDDVALAVTRALARLGEQAACAVRSNATAEDLPSASFAGQYDSYLNVVRPGAVLQHVSRCWASLFSERAVIYRLRNGFYHWKVQMAVVVQRMLFPHAAGILFTADPVTSNRKVAYVEASFGLGEALVSGLVNADVYKVRDGKVVAKAVATKELAIHASPAGGTEERAIEPERQGQPALTDAQVVQLAQLGRRIEAHFGHPQDIEWCLAEATSSRPSRTKARAGRRLAARQPPIETDPAIVTELIGRNQASIAALKRAIRTKSGSARLDFILADILELKRILFDPQSHQVFMAAMEASWWLNEQLEAWLGETNAADTLTQSVPHNVTSEMGLALLDVADVIRPHPDVVAFLQHVEDESFVDELPTLAGGREARDAIRAYLDKYGMRCVGEIDITKPRWSERPTTLVPMILGNIKNFEPGAGERRFEQGRQEAWKKEQELLERLRVLPDGERKAEETKRMIDRVRTFIGYREYPKYGMVSRYFVYKQALLEEAERLVQAHILREKEDIFYLTFQELHDVVCTHRVDDQLIRAREDAFSSYQALTPPRVLTSDGEVLAGTYRRVDVPAGALVGLPVSAGTIEGRARVILDMTEADLEAGDILVTAYTDPSWTPVFVAIKGLVTEVGGLLTHGAVIAREYGLPAVVGVEHATRLIRDGQRIRVHGTEGYVEILT